MSSKQMHKYAYEVDLDGESAAAHVIRMVGREKRVLELGTGPGSITRYLAGHNGCRVTGIEYDHEAILQAQAYCENIFHGDLNKPDWPSLLPFSGPYDVVVAADVLEHLYSPWDVLAQMKELIGDEGAIVVSLPHVGHAAVTACLLTEDFCYGEWGLLDRTHIRFFGVKNVQRLFDSAGLKILDAAFVLIPPEQTELSEQWSSLPEHVRLSLLENPYSSVYQVVVKAVPAGAPGPSLNVSEISVHKVTVTSVKAAEADLRAGEAGMTRLIAFYLPQYHPIPENDLWWGKGFTEWTNVTKAMPLFDGHYQPHLPADLGFYDLRLREIRHEQIDLAKSHGIDGFCYHYYWFSGKRLLNQPLDDMLADSDSNMPFCLCWANENWTRRWDAAEHEVLIAQEYGEQDDENFIKSLLPFFRDSRYIRLAGAPFLIVYRPQNLPNPNRSVEVWREVCRNNGIRDLHVACALTHGNTDYKKLGFDSGVEFPPHNLFGIASIANDIEFYEPFKGYVLPYHEIANTYLNRSYAEPNVFRTVFPSWDNTARTSSRALVVLNGTPANYEYWLAETIKRTRLGFPKEERFVFINAWNEWAEGCHLEPDRRFGHEFLLATLRAAKGDWRRVGFEDRLVPLPQRVHISTAREEVQRLKDEVERLQGDLASLYGSTSWRITRPARVLSRLRMRIFSSLQR